MNAVHKDGNVNSNSKENKVSFGNIIDHMFTFRMILEKCYEFNINVHQLYIDFKQAYDSINIKKLYDVLREMQIPAKLIRLVKITLKNTKAKIQVQGQLSREISIGRGLRQGDALSTTLLNVCLVAVIIRIEINPGDQ
jgi:hypothetical protein